MVDDPDAIWRPGYDGPTPSVGSVLDTDEPSSEPLSGQPERSSPDGPGRSRWFRVAVGVGLVLAMVAAAVALDPLDFRGEPDSTAVSDASVFGGPDGRRLPERAAELWSVGVDGAGDVWVEVIGRDLVVAAVERNGAAAPDSATVDPVTELVALDAVTGEPRWTSSFPARSSDLAVVGSVDGVLVVERPGESGPAVIGIDMRNGETRWSADARPSVGHVAVVGTTSIARLPPSPDEPVTLIDALTGSEIGTSPDDPTATGNVSIDVPLAPGSKMPVAGSNFVMTEPGSISGVVVEGDTENVVWSRNGGAVVARHPVDGGALLQVATRGGAGMELVDGLTGETVENLSMVPGALQALVVAGDGIVVLRPAVVGTKLAALELDGTERWSILGSEPVIVGDRLVVRATASQITAYGDAD